MVAEQLRIFESKGGFKSGRMILGFTGWMDGGEVSTGSVEYLSESLECRQAGRILPDDFYIYNIPGNMEVSAIFRPHVRIEEGLITEYDDADNTFYVNEENGLVLFVGREPHLKWGAFAECLFEAARRFSVEEIYFIGSVAGLVPHTREPRYTCSVSDEDLKEQFDKYNIRFSDYEGPASFTTYLTRQAGRMGLRMSTLVAEIPAYIQGRNPRCIESMVRRIASLLHIDVNVNALRIVADEVEDRLSKVIVEQGDLAEQISKLEEGYDQDVFENQMDDFKDYLIGRGIRLD